MRCSVVSISFRTAIFSLGLLASCSLWAAGPAGKYREELRNPLPRTNYTIVRTLNLNKDGGAELYSEYKGDRPTVNAIVRAALGRLMGDVREHRKVLHKGRWHENARRIVVELDRFEAGNDKRNLGSTFEFELSGNDLIARRQDSGDYGSQSLRLKMIEDWGSDRRDGSFDAGQHRGSYGWGTEVKSEDGNSYYVRRLKLNSDKSAELVSEYMGGRPSVDRSTTREYGALFAEVAANRKVVHTGKWREDRRSIRVELDRVGGGIYAQRVSSTFVFEPSGNELVPVETDQTDYGTRNIRLRKGWEPNNRGEGPMTPLPGRRSFEDIDTTSRGGGTLSHEGNRAREFSTARLILKADGRFELRLSGGSSETFKGRYELARNGVARLDVTEAFGRSATGNGEAKLGRQGGIGKITLRGDERGRRFTLNFSGRE